MEFKLIDNDFFNISCDVIVAYIFSGEQKLSGDLEKLDQLFEGTISQSINNGEITGKIGETTIIHSFGRISALRVIIVGLGARNKFKLETIRLAAGYGISAAQKIKAETIAIIIREEINNNNLLRLIIQAMTEGILLSNYRYDQLKTNNEENKLSGKLKEVLFITTAFEQTREIENGLTLGCIYGEAVNFTRDLVNTPANLLTPSILAEKAKELADEYGLELTILTEEEIIANKMNLMYSVGQGSEQPSKLIVLKYNTLNRDADLIALVGKGLTFDSGGISLKPSEGMQEMKNDLAGGAAVLGAMRAIAQLNPKSNVLGIIPAVENMPSGKATKPGDLFKGLAGKTVEVVNTDAEGRLVLADAVAYAHQLGAVKIIDIATLTGACLVALGKNYSAVVGNNRELIKQVIEAGEKSGEKFWQLPGDEEFKELLKSDVADLKNTGGRYAGTITGGLFIGEFLPPEVPWVHLDIAGTAWTDKNRSYFIKGATGFGVRTLTNLVMEIDEK